MKKSRDAQKFLQQHGQEAIEQELRRRKEMQKNLQRSLAPKKTGGKKLKKRR